MPFDIAATSSRLAATILGRSPLVQALRGEIVALASHLTTVLIMGPSGTGKELVAHGIHDCGPRHTGPFIPVDCTSITGNLFASQLFGHRKGAFTGADYEAIGCFRAAHGGTIFLDEIGELEPDLQAGLLRVLEEKTVVPVGSHQGIPVDVRVVAATNRNLKQEVASGRFRQDLYFRLAVAMIETVPLRQRPEDIPELAEHFLRRMAQDNGLPAKALSAAALRVLQHFDWPGNVRQLRHVLEQAVIAGERTTIGPYLIQQLLAKACLPPAPSDRCGGWPPPVPSSALALRPEGHRVTHSAAPAERWVTLGEVERQHIVATLERTSANRSAAARLLGITRQALLRKIQKYDIPTAAAGRTPR